jgi:hypothetical protein
MLRRLNQVETLQKFEIIVVSHDSNGVMDGLDTDREDFTLMRHGQGPFKASQAAASNPHTLTLGEHPRTRRATNVIFTQLLKITDLLVRNRRTYAGK